MSLNRRTLVMCLSVGMVLAVVQASMAQTGPLVSGTAVGLPDGTGRRDPVVGVTVQLLAANGTPLATTRTADDGSFSFAVPAGAGNSVSIRFSGQDALSQERADTVVGSLNPEVSHNLSAVVPVAQSNGHGHGKFRKCYSPYGLRSCWPFCK